MRLTPTRYRTPSSDQTRATLPKPACERRLGAKGTGDTPMPLDLATLRNDKAFDALTAAILDRDQPRTTDLFYKMVADEGRSVGEALSVVTAAEAPFVQVPNHINVKDGQVVLVNNDHTILGLRTSADL